jgi:superoxide reductase
MAKLGELVQAADWKKEKHVPVIECAASVKSGEMFEIKVSIGKEVSHPNTTEHHIQWIQVFFHPEGEQYAYELARCELTAHGESVKGANEGPVYTHHAATVTAMIRKPGTIYALSLCNIHGLWENSKEVKLG